MVYQLVLYKANSKISMWWFQRFIWFQWTCIRLPQDQLAQAASQLTEKALLTLPIARWPKGDFKALALDLSSLSSARPIIHLKLLSSSWALERKQLSRLRCCFHKWLLEAKIYSQRNLPADYPWDSKTSVTTENSCSQILSSESWW